MHDVLLLASRDEKMVEFGKEIGRLFTDHGLPIDMSLSRLSLSGEQSMSILHGACMWLVEHKRLSGASEESIERQRKSNRKLIERFAETGEVGLY